MHREMIAERKDVQLLQREPAAGALVLAKSGILELGDNILRTVYVSVFNHCDIIGLQSYRIR